MVLPMREINSVTENSAINSWLSHFSRSPEQVNRPHEADAELIKIPGIGSYVLTTTIDTVSEEIDKKLYRDPFTMGWVTVMANFSDLAAVGAEPLGIVVAISLEASRGKKFRDGIARGMAAACQELGVYLLGGDTNTALNCSLTGCAIGLVPSKQKMMRSGCSPGDTIFLSGGAGSGNALGLTRMLGLSNEFYQEEQYRPKSRLKEGRLIRKYATCCMDTSDGLLITLDQLSRINNLGFIIEAGWKDILDPEVWGFCRKVQVPPWFMAAGIHGEFELVFAVPQEKEKSFLVDMAKKGFFPIRLGVVEQDPYLGVVLESGKKVKMDLAPLRNLWEENQSDYSKLIKEYHSWGKKWGLE
jgi:thiamine-monophosphate kinase